MLLAGFASTSISTVTVTIACIIDAATAALTVTSTDCTVRWHAAAGRSNQGDGRRAGIYI